MTYDPGELVAEFYEAALAPAQFPQVLRHLARFAGGTGAILLTWDKRAAEVALHATGGHTGADAPEHYRRHYAPLDPYRRVLETRPTGAWTTCADFFDDAFVARDAFYNDYLLPRGVRYMSAARVLTSDAYDAYVGVHRGPRDGPFARDVVDRLARLGGQFGRALRLHLDTVQSRIESEVGTAGLDRMAQPALLVDPDARILHANPAAEARLRAGDALTARQGRLTMAATADAGRLRGLIDAATRARLGGEMRLDGPARHTVPLTVTVAPAGTIATAHSLAPAALALVIVTEPPADG
jgi:hypothetical protein